MAQDAKILELGWSWCHTTSDKKDLFTSVTPLQASNSPAAQTAMLVTLRFFVHLLPFLHDVVCHYFLSIIMECLLRYASLFITKFYVGRYLAPLPFQSGVVLVTLRSFVHLRPFL